MRQLVAQWAIALVVFGGALTLSASRSALAQAAETHATEASSDLGTEEPHPEGVPLSFKTDLALWSVVTFLVFLFVLKQFAWTPLIEGLDKRESRIRQDLADAETARVKAEQLLSEHEAKLAAVQDDVREIIAEARRDAEHTKNDIVTQAQKEAEMTRQRAIDDIGRARDHALKELFDVTADQVVNATQHVLGRSLTDQDRGRLIDEAMAQIAEQSGSG